MSRDHHDHSKLLGIASRSSRAGNEDVSESSAELREIHDTTATALPFHIPFGIGTIEPHQDLRIRDRLLLRHDAGTVD